MAFDMLSYDAAMQRLGLDRDIYQNIQLPTFNDVTRPGAVSGLTGMLMDRPDLYGNLAGLPTFGALSGAASMFGEVGADDPRWQALGYAPGQKTLGGRELDLRGDQQRAAERQAELARQNSESAAQFAQRNAETQRIQDQRNLDAKMSAEYGVSYINGQQAPSWMEPHMDWVRQYQDNHNGTIPQFGELVAQLGQYGMRPEDFNGGRAYPGTLPTAGPGIVNEPGKGYVDYTAGGKVITNETELRGVVQNRMAMAPKIVGQDPATGQPIYSQPGGAAVQNGEAIMHTMAQPGAPAASRGLLPDGAASGAATGLNFGGSGATAQLGAGRAMSPEQRALLEQGRQTDVRAQLEQNGQAIQDKQVEYQHAVATGQLDLANRAQAELTDLNNRKLALEQSGQAFQQGLAAGTLTGSYNGQDTIDKQRLNQAGSQFSQELDFKKGVATGMVDGQETLDRGALLGTFNGMSTLAGQQAYGGSALVNGGLTLDAQKAVGRVGGQETLESQAMRGYTPQGATLAREGQEADTALKALQLESTLRADPFKLEQYRRGLSQTGVPNSVLAVAGRGQIPGVGGGYGPAPGPATLAGAVGAVAGPTFGNVARAQAGGAPQMASVEQQAAALGPLNKMKGREYAKLDGAGKGYVRSLYKGIGEAADDEDVENAYRRSLPQFAARRTVPTFGRAA